MDTKHSTNRNNHVNITLDFSRKGAPRYLASKIEEGLSEGYHIFKLRLKKQDSPLFPNICVPIAGIIDYYRMTANCEFTDSREYRLSHLFADSGIIKPYELDSGSSIIQPKNALNCVWKFNPDTHYAVITKIMDAFRRSGAMGAGILSGLELALNEVTDNTIQHSQNEPASADVFGYVMGQYHKHNHRIAVAVFDSGRGIRSSLESGRGMAIGSRDALTLALQRGVTSGQGAGNGLWLMSRIVEAANGSFELTSDNVMYSVRHDADTPVPIANFSSVKKLKTSTTLVDFQIDTDLNIDLEKTLAGHKPADLWIEDRLLDDLENVKIMASFESRGFGSRYEAKAFCNIVLNAMNNIDGKCIIDFSNVSVISASFADELITRLIYELGIVGYTNRISLVNLTGLCRTMFDDCIKHRLCNQI